MQGLGAGGALGGPARPGVNFVGQTANLGAAPHDWGFAKKAQIQPPTHTLDPKLINVYAKVFRNHRVTSDVHFRKGALTPSFWVGLGWVDLE